MKWDTGLAGVKYGAELADTELKDYPSWRVISHLYHLQPPTTIEYQNYSNTEERPIRFKQKCLENPVRETCPTVGPVVQKMSHLGC